VTTEGKVSITTTQGETKTGMVPSIPNIINITKDTILPNTFYSTSNTLYTKKQVNTSEKINTAVLEHTFSVEDTTKIMNAANTSQGHMTELNYKNDNSILNTFLTLNTTMNKFTNLENNNTFPIFPTLRQNETDNPNARYQNATNYNKLNSSGITYHIPENDNHLDNNDTNSNTQTSNSIDKSTASENIKYITEQNKTTDNITSLHTNKTIHNTEKNESDNVNIITHSELNTDEPSIAVTGTTQNDVTTNSDTESYEETTTAATTMYESTSDTTFTESYMPSTLTAENKDVWIFTEEEEDSAFSLPEMPALASDPLALKELPRPMVLENDVSCEDWCQMSSGKSKHKGWK
jgi:hypothetical protein